MQRVLVCTLITGVKFKSCSGLELLLLAWNRYRRCVLWISLILFWLKYSICVKKERLKLSTSHEASISVVVPAAFVLAFVLPNIQHGTCSLLSASDTVLPANTRSWCHSCFCSGYNITFVSPHFQYGTCSLPGTSSVLTACQLVSVLACKFYYQQQANPVQVD